VAGALAIKLASAVEDVTLDAVGHGGVLATVRLAEEGAAARLASEAVLAAPNVADQQAVGVMADEDSGEKALEPVGTGRGGSGSGLA